MRPLVLWLAVILIVCAACSQKPTAALDDAGTAQHAQVIDAGPPGPVALDVRVSFAVPDAGIELVALDVGQRATVPQAERIELETNQPVRNYRVRLFDEIDKVVPSDDSADDLPERLRYVIGLETPLKTGYRYALVFDAQTGAAMLDAQGQPVPDLRYEFTVAGERQKPPPPPPKKKATRRRGK